MRECGMPADPRGAGEGKPAGTVCGGEDAKHDGKGRGKWAVEICVRMDKSEVRRMGK